MIALGFVIAAEFLVGGWKITVFVPDDYYYPTDLRPGECPEQDIYHVRGGPGRYFVDCYNSRSLK